MTRTRRVAILSLLLISALAGSGCVAHKAYQDALREERLEHWDLAQDVNVRGIYLVSRAALPHLRAAGGGAIVNISSVAARRAHPFLAYKTTKTALIALTEANSSPGAS